MNKLLIVGTVAFDAIETPFGKRDKIIGGSATYISLSASNFYKPIHIVSVVGGDFPKKTLSDFNKRGITTEGIQIKKGEKVGRNSPCPCGSGKKYKNCHGANA